MQLSASQVIRRPAGEVFAFIADAANNPRWQRGMRSCEWTSTRPIAVGSTYRQRASFLGREVVNEFVVIDHGPTSITIRSTGGSFPIVVQRSVTPIDGSTSRAEASIAGEPGRFFRLAGPVLRRVAQRSVDADYRRLKELLERG